MNSHSELSQHTVNLYNEHMMICLSEHSQLTRMTNSHSELSSEISQWTLTVNSHSELSQWTLTVNSHSELSQWTLTVNSHSELPWWIRTVNSHGELPWWTLPMKTTSVHQCRTTPNLWTKNHWTSVILDIILVNHILFPFSSKSTFTQCPQWCHIQNLWSATIIVTVTQLVTNTHLLFWG